LIIFSTIFLKNSKTYVRKTAQHRITKSVHQQINSSSNQHIIFVFQKKFVILNHSK